MALDKYLVPVLPFVVVIQCLTSRVDSNNQSLIMLNTSLNKTLRFDWFYSQVMYARVTRPFVLCAHGLIQRSGNARLNGGRVRNVMIRSLQTRDDGIYH